MHVCICVYVCNNMKSERNQEKKGELWEEGEGKEDPGGGGARL